MPFNDFQKAALATYADGDFKSLTTLREVQKTSGDPLLLFVLRELHSPDDLAEAMERINSAINDLTGVFQQLILLKPQVKIEKVESADVDAALHGWYINFYDTDGKTFDNIGPFDSEREARDQHLAREYESF